MQNAEEHAIPTDLAGALAEASRVVVMTGAGVSAESGVPTFRDALDGLWARYDPADLATPEAFRRDPALVTRWYDERRLALGACEPNPGHFAIARLERALAERGRSCSLVTQNVDRLHQAAGSPEAIELHGTLWMWRCRACGAEAEERGGAFGDYPPRCACGGARRPGVVWFGEVLPEDAIVRALDAMRSCDLVLLVGTSSVVYPAAGLVDEAIGAGARVAEINPEATPRSGHVDWSIRARSGVALPALVDAAFGES